MIVNGTVSKHPSGPPLVALIGLFWATSQLTNQGLSRIFKVGPFFEKEETKKCVYIIETVKNQNISSLSCSPSTIWMHLPIAKLHVGRPVGMSGLLQEEWWSPRY